jgi:hypothetical protein
LYIKRHVKLDLPTPADLWKVITKELHPHDRKNKDGVPNNNQLVQLNLLLFRHADGSFGPLVLAAAVDNSLTGGGGARVTKAAPQAASKARSSAQRGSQMLRDVPPNDDDRDYCYKVARWAIRNSMVIYFFFFLLVSFPTQSPFFSVLRPKPQQTAP